MLARIYVRLYMFLHGLVIWSLLGGLLSLTCFIYGHIVGGIGIIVEVVFALMSILFLAVPILSVMRSKKSFDDLEQRALIEDAARQLRTQPHWGERCILTKDYYFDRTVGKVIYLKDIVRIELNRTTEYNEDQGNAERIELRLTTHQGEILCPSSTGPQWEKERLQRQFETLQARFPEKVGEQL